MNKKTRFILSCLVLLVTLGVLSEYLSKHRNLLAQLGHTPPTTIIWVLLLYGLWLAALVGILDAILRICNKSIPTIDNILLNAYSLFANFFIPGQTGPALRGVYLKKRYAVRYRDYIYGMLLYYFFYALISILLLIGASQSWWITLLILIGSALFGLVAFKLYAKRLHATHKQHVPLLGSALLLAATLLQTVIQIAIYLIEVHAVDHHVAFRQVVVYTGAANLALFVGLTPGAIGIRESFLILSERLHHISSNTIISANIIDRGVYLVFLGFLFLLILSARAHKSLRSSLGRQGDDDSERHLSQ